MTPPPGKGMVWFIGAGPGDPDLITVKGRRLIQEADLVLYAGSLVPARLVAEAKQGAKVMDSASMTLAETHAAMAGTARAGGLVARVHTGDPALFGALDEQMALLDAEAIPYAVVPGVSAAFAAAASARISLTSPERAQAFAITRMPGRTPVPENQTPAAYARHGAGMAVYLSAARPEDLERDLIQAGLAPDTPVLIAGRVSQPEERLARTTLDALARTAREQGFDRQTVFLVLPGLQGPGPASRLYDPSFSHGFRKAGES